MSHHERTLTPRTFNFTFSDLPGTNKAFQSYCENKTMKSFSEVAKICIEELTEKQYLSFALPKDLINSLVSILGTMVINETIEDYIPILNLLQILLSCTVFAVPPALVNQLCLFLSLIKHHEPNNSLIACTFAVVDALYHLALSRRKKAGDRQDSEWIQKIFFSFTGLLHELITRPELKEIALAQYKTNQQRISLESRVSKSNSSTDLVLYLSLAMVQLVKILSSAVPHEILSITMPLLLAHVISELQVQPHYDFHHLHLSINLEKSVASMTLVNTLCMLTAKVDTGRQFVKVHSDKIKSLFFYTVLGYFKQPVLALSQNFAEDESALGRFFTLLNKLFSASLIHSDMEAFPILLLSVLLQPVSIT